jgi:hypothetical protein
MTEKVLAEKLHRGKHGLEAKIQKLKLHKRPPYVQAGLTSTKEGKKAYMKQYHQIHKNEQQHKLRLRYAQDPEYRARVRVRSTRYVNQCLDRLRKQIGQIIKEAGKCQRCGFSDLRALQVHHQFGRNKTLNSYQEMKQIIEKQVPFVILCANCHVIIHGNNKRFD